MSIKRLLRPERQRQIPPQFSWLDHRLVRERRLQNCEPPAWALYLFLVTVGDFQGLSYYSDASLSRHLRLDPLPLSRAREQLLAADLIAYQKPLYQVLSLDSTPELEAPRQSGSEARSLGQILCEAMARGGTP